MFCFQSNEIIIMFVVELIVDDYDDWRIRIILMIIILCVNHKQIQYLIGLRRAQFVIDVNTVRTLRVTLLMFIVTVTVINDDDSVCDINESFSWKVCIDINISWLSIFMMEKKDQMDCISSFLEKSCLRSCAYGYVWRCM